MHRIFLLLCLAGWPGNGLAAWVIETTPLGVLVSIGDTDLQIPSGSVAVVSEDASRLEVSVYGDGKTLLTSLKEPLLLQVNGKKCQLDEGQSLSIE